MSNVRRIWQRLMDFYGSRLAEAYGPQPPPDWVTVLEAADDEALGRAMTEVRREHLHFPPTLGEFEAALAKVTVPVSRARPDSSKRLSDYVIEHYKLTPTQLALRWTYIGREYLAQNVHGKLAQAFDIVGVIVPADGEATGYRVMLEDIEGDAPPVGLCA